MKVGLAKAVALLVSVAGCTQSQEIYMPDGSKAHLIQCPGNLGDCYAKANEICGGPYQAVRGDDVPARANLVYNPAIGRLMPITTPPMYSLYIQCVPRS